MSIAALLTLFKNKTMVLSDCYKSTEDGKEEHSSSVFIRIYLTVEKYHLSRVHMNVLLGLLSMSYRTARPLCQISMI